MSKWISIEEAASKYGVEVDEIHIWAELRGITRSAIGDTFTVDDESIQEYLDQNRLPATGEYLRTLKQLYENQLAISETYLEIIAVQKNHLQYQIEDNSRIKKLLGAMENQNQELTGLLELIETPGPSPFRNLIGWLAKLKNNFER